MAKNANRRIAQRIRRLESGVRSLECGVRSPECGVRSRECGVRSLESGVRSWESRALELQTSTAFFIGEPSSNSVSDAVYHNTRGSGFRVHGFWFLVSGFC